jgi:auxin influx carrier (AUX1 LAX family)
LPAALFVWFIALAIPFFGVVNDLLGAFCVTFETFILPPLAFNLYYQGRPDRQAAAFIKPRWVAITPLSACEMLAACTVQR